MLSRSLTAALALALPIAASACVDPKHDFDAYNDRTTGFRETKPVDASVPDTAPPTESFEGLYFAACLSTLAAGRIDRVLRFYTELKFTPDATGGTGKLSLKLTALKLGPNNGPPPTVGKDQLVGTSLAITDTPTTAAGVYAAAFGTANIPGAANPISGRDIVVEMAQLPGRFAKDKFCSQLIGHVVQPTDIPLEGASNTCIYLPVKEGDATPAIKNEDFAGGCSLQ
ncbi:MAG TPA: hypothetical protein VLT33_43885 [Labilithrix sp.]|nr:hypothetical protein [Labilithrix sp.]